MQAIRGYVVESLLARDFANRKAPNCSLYGLLARTVETDGAPHPSGVPRAQSGRAFFRCCSGYAGERYRLFPGSSYAITAGPITASTIPGYPKAEISIRSPCGFGCQQQQRS